MYMNLFFTIESSVASMYIFFKQITNDNLCNVKKHKILALRIVECIHKSESELSEMCIDEKWVLCINRKNKGKRFSATVECQFLRSCFNHMGETLIVTN